MFTVGGEKRGTGFLFLYIFFLRKPVTDSLDQYAPSALTNSEILQEGSISVSLPFFVECLYPDLQHIMSHVLIFIAHSPSCGIVHANQK